MGKSAKTLVILTLFIFSLSAISLAQPLPEQEISGQERARQKLEEESALREKIEKEKTTPEIEEEKPPVEPAPSVPTEEKILIQKIKVSGATLFSEEWLKIITSPFENKELTVREMQKIADQITDSYRQGGYITSRAYLPPQKIESGVLEIRVIEGVMGDLEIKGNRHFKTRLIKNKIVLQKGEYFNYNALRKSLTRINEHPDRSARAVLAPGKEPGATDVILEVKERLPIHVGFDWDNFGSRYIGKNRYSVRFSHNNLLGIDDKLRFQYQLAEASRYFLKNIRYLVPVTDTAEAGFFAAFSRVKLGRESEDLDARGKSKIYGIFANKSLLEKENMDLNFNFGFDYKDITNYQNQAVSSSDRLRVAKLGLDLDLSDNYGRSLISNETDFGLARIMGGLRAKDPKASRAGAGGKFVKNTINALRLQKMPFSSTLLWKNQLQLCSYILSSSEQFQIGGIANVRGYPPAEAVGDRGYSTTWEWTCPPYYIPKNIQVPFSKAKLYDALRFAIFYDLASARLRRPTATEEKYKTLRGVGFGMRFNLPEDLSLRIDCAWPLDNTPTDSNHARTWIQASQTF